MRPTYADIYGLSRGVCMQALLLQQHWYWYYGYHTISHSLTWSNRTTCGSHFPTENYYYCRLIVYTLVPIVYKHTLGSWPCDPTKFRVFWLRFSQRDPEIPYLRPCTRFYSCHAMRGPQGGSKCIPRVTLNEFSRHMFGGGR